MRDPIKFVFTVMYRWAHNLNLDKSPQETVLVSLVLLLCFNLMVLYVKFFLEKPSQLTAIEGLSMALISYLYLYWRFSYKSKYKEIEK